MTAPRGFPVDDCRTCNARIIWARTVNGKAIPVDADVSKAGNVRLSWESADVKAEVIGPAHAFGQTGLRASHFVTCPNADEWRRKGGKSFDATAAHRRIRGTTR